MKSPLLSKNKPPFGPVKQTVAQYTAENFCHCSHNVKPEECPIHAYHHINGMVVHHSELPPVKALPLFIVEVAAVTAAVWYVKVWIWVLKQINKVLGWVRGS